MSRERSAVRSALVGSMELAFGVVVALIVLVCLVGAIVSEVRRERAKRWTRKDTRAVRIQTPMHRDEERNS